MATCSQVHDSCCTARRPGRGPGHINGSQNHFACRSDQAHRDLGSGNGAGDFLFIAGMRGINPTSNDLVAGDDARVRQAFLNMQLIAESEGASLRDAVRLVVYVTDMIRFRPIVNKVQAELWGQGPYPPRTIVEVQRLNQDDLVEVEGTFYVPAR